MKLTVASSAATALLFLSRATVASEAVVDRDSAVVAAAGGGEEDEIERRRRHLRSNVIGGDGGRSAPGNSRLLKMGRDRHRNEFGITDWELGGRAGDGKKNGKKAGSWGKKVSKKGMSEANNFAGVAATSSTTISASTATTNTSTSTFSTEEVTTDVSSTETPAMTFPDPPTFLSNVPCDADWQCRPHSWYCDSSSPGCHCTALHIHDMFAPGCEPGTKACQCVYCLIDACTYKQAVCDPDLDVCRVVNKVVSATTAATVTTSSLEETTSEAKEATGTPSAETTGTTSAEETTGTTSTEETTGSTRGPDEVDPDEERTASEILMDDLVDNMSKWNDLGLRDYDFVLSIPFSSASLDAGAFLIEVRDGVLSAISDVYDGGEELAEVPTGVPVTVLELFDVIASFVESEPSPDSIVVSYEDEFGFPIDILVDPDDEVKGDEVRYIVDLTPRYDYSDLRNYENTWDETGLVNYDMVTSQMCEGCGDSGPFLVEVRNGMLVDWSYIDGAFQKASPKTVRTVSDLFGFIRSVLDNGGHDGVKYNEEWGYPEEIYVDHNSTRFGEETSFVIYKIRSREAGVEEEAEVEMCGPKGTNLENECEWTQYCCNPSCGMCAPLGGFCTMQFCMPVEVDDVGEEFGIDVATEQARLDNNTAKWTSSGVVDYNFTYQRSCFCLEDYRGPWDVEVKGGSVNRATPTPPSDLKLPTIPGLLDVIQSAITARVDAMQVSYDATFGYPFDVYIDHDFRIADEETSFDVTNFAPLLVD